MFKAKVESQIRHQIHELVNPIILLAKRNIDHNASKNDRFLEGKKAVEQLALEIQTLRAEASHLPFIKEKLKTLEQETQLQFAYYRGRVEAYESELAKIKQAFTEIEELRTEVNSSATVNDLRITKTNDVQLLMQQQQVSKHSTLEMLCKNKLKTLKQQLNKEVFDRESLQKLVNELKKQTDQNEVSLKSLQHQAVTEKTQFFRLLDEGQ